MSTRRRTTVDDNPHDDPDAGHTTRALRYAEKANAAEQLIVDALGDIIGKLVSMAKEGDIPAARYLCDRIYGRVARRPTPPVDDWGKAKWDDVQKREDVIRQSPKPVAQPFDDIFKSRIPGSECQGAYARLPGSECQGAYARLPGIGRIPGDVEPFIKTLRKDQTCHNRT